MNFFKSINCTNETDEEICSFLNYNQFDKEFTIVTLIVLLAISIIGIMFNTLSAYIFTFSNNMETKFLQLLKYKFFGCLTMSISALGTLLSLYFDSSNFELEWLATNRLRNHFEWMFFEFIINQTVYITINTFTSCVDIFLVYERIQLYRPRLTFLKTTRPIYIIVVLLVYSFLITLPQKLVMEIDKIHLHVNSNQTGNVYKVR